MGTMPVRITSSWTAVLSASGLRSLLRGVSRGLPATAKREFEEQLDEVPVQGVGDRFRIQELRLCEADAELAEDGRDVLRGHRQIDPGSPQLLLEHPPDRDANRGVARAQRLAQLRVSEGVHEELDRGGKEPGVGGLARDPMV